MNDGASVRVRPDHERSIVSGLSDLIVSVDIGRDEVVADLALRTVRVLLGEDLRNIRGADAIAAKLLRIEIDPDRRQRATDNLDLSDARELGELLPDDGGGSVEQPPLVWIGEVM